MKGAIIENNKVYIFRVIRRPEITLLFLVFQSLTLAGCTVVGCYLHKDVQAEGFFSFYIKNWKSY